MEDKTIVIRFIIGTVNDVIKHCKILPIGDYVGDLTLKTEMKKYTSKVHNPKETCLFVCTQKTFDTTLNKTMLLGDFETKIIDNIDEVQTIIDSRQYRYVFIIDNDYIDNLGIRPHAMFDGIHSYYVWYKKYRIVNKSIGKRNTETVKLPINLLQYKFEMMRYCNNSFNIYKYKNIINGNDEISYARCNPEQNTIKIMNSVPHYFAGE